MAKIREIDIQCVRCNRWSPSMIFFENTDVFNRSTLLGNKQLCLLCGEETPCNKENVRVRIEGQDTYFGIDTDEWDSLISTEK